MREHPATEKWTSAIDALVIPVTHDGVEIIATAITSGDGLDETGRKIKQDIGLFSDQCILGHARVFALHRDGALVATTVIRSVSGAWQHRNTRGQRNRKISGQLLDAGEVLSRAYQTADDRDGPQPHELNAIAPQALPSLRNPSIRRAAEHYRAAQESPPGQREELWAKALEAARIGTQAPGDDTGLYELAFGWQLAVNAAVMSEQYDVAADLLAEVKLRGRQAINLAAALNEKK